MIFGLKGDEACITRIQGFAQIFGKKQMPCLMIEPMRILKGSNSHLAE
jgi:hypothetical protein